MWAHICLLFQDHFFYDSNTLASLSSVDHSQTHPVVRRHQHSPSMPSMPAALSCTRATDPHNCRSTYNMPLSQHDSRSSHCEQDFINRPQQAMTGSLGQFPNRLQTRSPAMLGLGHGAHSRGYSTGTIPGGSGYGISMVSGNGNSAHDMMMCGSMSLDCTASAINKRNIR